MRRSSLLLTTWLLASCAGSPAAHTISGRISVQTYASVQYSRSNRSCCISTIDATTAPAPGDGNPRNE